MFILRQIKRAVLSQKSDNFYSELDRYDLGDAVYCVQASWHSSFLADTARIQNRVANFIDKLSALGDWFLWAGSSVRPLTASKYNSGSTDLCAFFGVQKG